MLEGGLQIEPGCFFCLERIKLRCTMGEQLTKKENLFCTKMKTGPKYSYKERSNIKKKN